MRGELSGEPYGLGLAMIMWADVMPESASTAATLEVRSIMMSFGFGRVSLKTDLTKKDKKSGPYDWKDGLIRSRENKQKLQALLLRECLVREKRKKEGKR